MRARIHVALRTPGAMTVALLAMTLLLAACGTTTTAGTTAGANAGSPTATTDNSGGYGYIPRPTSTSAASSSPAANANAKQITIGGAIGSFSFSPATMTIPAGTTVVWTNDSGAPHTVTSDTGAPAAFDSGAVNASGGTFSFTFAQPGTYHYHCNYHPYMHGTIVVTG